MHLIFRNTLSDILELNRSIRDQRVKGYLTTVMGVALLLVGACRTTVQESQPEPAPEFTFFTLGAVFILLGVFATRLAGIGAWFLKTRHVADYEIEIGQQGVVFLNGREQPLVGWQTFSRWYVTKNLLVLVAPGEALAIPKRSCGEQKCQELLALVRSGLGNPARW